MEKRYILKLLHKYLKGDLAKEEKHLLETYYNLFQNEPDIMDTLSMEERKEFKNDIKDAIWDKISRDEQPTQKVQFLNKRMIKIAAAAVLIMVFSTSLFFLLDGSSKKQTNVNTSLAVNHKVNRVVFLQDGSKVILSAGSKFNYPSSFEGLEKREVFLEGQAFFDIQHNPSKPFIVHTSRLETIVLGTAFNIKAISGETDITVTVKRGKVKVTDQNKTLGVITPNQQITYNKGEVSYSMKIVESDSYLDWKEQDLLFDNLTVAEAAKLLEERYKVRITISDQSISSQRFSASFPKNESFEQALKIICVFNEVTYKYDKEKSTVIISNNK
ncbi:MAG: anti-FecI sigma factor FecR [Ferruginibacter sp.]|nr:anti-FecI sigma factor FecR [Ferruginibacter sp.]